MMRSQLLFAQIALALGLSWLFGRPFRANHEPTRAGGPTRAALEAAIVILVMLLFSPMTGKAHCGVVLIPALCLARLAIIDRRRDALAALIGSGVLFVACMDNVVGTRVADTVVWYGGVTALLLILLVGCGFALWRESSVASSQELGAVRPTTGDQAASRAGGVAPDSLAA